MLKSASQKIRKLFEQPVNKAIDTVAGVFANADQLSQDDMMLLAMVKAVLPAEPEMMEKAFSRIRNRLERQSFSDRKISTLLEFLRKVAPGTPEKTVKVLANRGAEEKQQFIENLLALSLDADEYRSDALELTRQLALLAGLAEDDFTAMAEKIKTTRNNRSKILRSGTGIILALIVIGLFVLIATWLSSLLFGVVLAYIFLPLEQHIEWRLRREPGGVARFFRKVNPVGKIGKHLQRQNKYELSAEEQKRREDQALTTKAVTLTVSCVVAGFLAIILALVLLLCSYVKSFNHKTTVAENKATAAKVECVESAEAVQANMPSSSTVLPGNVSANVENIAPGTPAKLSWWGKVKNKFSSWSWGKKKAKELTPEEKIAAEKAAKTPTFTRTVSNKLISVLNNLKVRFQKLPLIQGILTELSNYLADDKAEKQLTELVLKKSGGLFAFITKFAAMFAAFLLNILMTFFFFSLLLGKIAGFVNGRKNPADENSNNDQATSYLIRTVFNGRWLPQMSEENLREGDRIVGEVFNKLRIWLKGYMTLVAIDFCVYTTVFYLLDVPYAPILGAVAAVGILLPYIGPVSSALLTVLVTLAVGGAGVSVLQIAGIIGIYLLHNGIIEQFFIYPAVIGESLGLSTLETIIVVLLGGIIAGIPGMIFALPTASVIKYLVPQIYRCWR